MSVALWKYGSSFLGFISFFSVGRERMKMDYPTKMAEEYHHHDKIPYFALLSFIDSDSYLLLSTVFNTMETAI